MGITVSYFAISMSLRSPKMVLKLKMVLIFLAAHVLKVRIFCRGI